MSLTPVRQWEIARIRQRMLLLIAAGLVILVGATVLSLEAAVYFLNARIGVAHFNILTIIGCVAVFFAVLAGIASLIAGRGSSTPKGANRNFIISAILSAIAAISLIVVVSLTLPSAVGWWGPPAVLQENILPSSQNPDFLQPETTFSWRNSQMNDGRSAENGVVLNDEYVRRQEQRAHDRQTLYALKWSVLAGAMFLLFGTLVCGVISVINYRSIGQEFKETVKYHLAPRASTAYQDPRVDRMITDL